MESGLELLTLYHNGHSAEMSWLDGMQSRVRGQPPISGDFRQAQDQVDQTMVGVNVTVWSFLLCVQLN